MILFDTGHFDEDGIWVSDNPKQFRSWLVANKDKKITLEGKRYNRNRSNHQNAYYWGVVLRILSEHTGHSSDELHEYCKSKFNPKHIEINGQIELIGKTTQEMSTIEFEDYLEKVRIWAATELGVSIPLPNEG